MGRLPKTATQDAESLSISGLYRKVDRALHAALPGQHWVTGEVRSVSVSSRGHCYMDLVDPATRNESDRPVLKAVCWSTQWARIRTNLDQLGIVFDAGLVVRIRGEVQLYRPRGEISFIVSELDTDALLGKVAAERARLVKSLVDTDLYDRNRRVLVPAVPSCIGLVASPGTEGFRDFLGQVEESGIGFRVRIVPTRVQGRGAPALVAGAIRRLQSAGCDVIVIVRGGGSKADLATFDPKRWPGPSPAPTSPSGRVSATPVTCRSLTKWPTGRSSRRLTAGESSPALAVAYWRSAVGRGLEVSRQATQQLADAVGSWQRRRRSVETCAGPPARPPCRPVGAPGPLVTGRSSGQVDGRLVELANRSRAASRGSHRILTDEEKRTLARAARMTALPLRCHRGGGAPHLSPQEPARCLRLPAAARTRLFRDARRIRCRRALGRRGRARCPARDRGGRWSHRIDRLRHRAGDGPGLADRR